MSDFSTTGWPPMIGRKLTAAEWRDYVASYDFGTIPPARLVLHHTYRPNEQQWQGATSMRGMQRYYATLGWSAAPHIYVGPDGIWLFTPMRDVGIHAGLGNQGYQNGVWWYSIGLEMVGYFDYERPTGAVWDYAKTVMGTLSQRLNIPPRQLISFHRDYTNKKSCPGWAVTKDWVLGEVEAWLNNTTPPSVDAGSIGTPPPIDELVLERLLQESYARRSKGYHIGWAFHQYAVSNGLGMPLAPSKRITLDDKEYSYQTFARDTLYSEVPNWGEVRLLSELLGGSIPPAGLGRVLLESTYRDSGATFHADWAFHQYALSAGLGPALGKSFIIDVDGVEYSYQPFAVDTLYSEVPNWTDVRELSRLAHATDPEQVRLRESLLHATYQSVGTEYHADWAFHQLAMKWHLGTPLSHAHGIDIEGTEYNIQVYATDTLYNIVPNWQDVRRLSELARIQGLVLGEVSSKMPVLHEARWEPLTIEPFPILRYTSNPAPSALSSRAGSRVSLVVLHGDPGPAHATLDAMAQIGAAHSTHYYVTVDGTIYSLIEEQYAAWHAGMAPWEGRTQNLNRISIGVVLERPTDTAVSNTDYDIQRKALGWLLKSLALRHDLAPNALLHWHTTQPKRALAHSTRALTDIAPERFPVES